MYPKCFIKSKAIYTLEFFYEFLHQSCNFYDTLRQSFYNFDSSYTSDDVYFLDFKLGFY